MWMTGPSPVGNPVARKAFLWTATGHPQEGQIIHSAHPRFVHSALAAPPATMRLVHTIHRPYDDDEPQMNGSGPEHLGMNTS
jgi:hypothetical protein